MIQSTIRQHLPDRDTMYSWVGQAVTDWGESFPSQSTRMVPSGVTQRTTCVAIHRCLVDKAEVCIHVRNNFQLCPFA